MMDLRVQKQHCTELKLLNQENHNPKKLLPPEAGIQLTLQAPMGHTLTENQRNVHTCKAVLPSYQATHCKLTDVIWICWVGLSIFTRPFES